MLCLYNYPYSDYRVCHKVKPAKVADECVKKYIYIRVADNKKFAKYLPIRLTASVGSYHRDGLVLSFFSSRRNWGSPTSSPAGECAHSHWFRGGDTLAGEGAGESQFRQGDIR